MRAFWGGAAALAVLGWAGAAGARDCDQVFSRYEAELHRASDLTPREALDVLKLLLEMERRHSFMCFGYYSRGRVLVQERKALESRLEEAGIDMPRPEPRAAAKPGPANPAQESDAVPAPTRRSRQEQEQEQGQRQRHEGVGQPSESSLEHEREEHPFGALGAKLVEKRPVKAVWSTAWMENLVSTGVTIGGVGGGLLLSWIGGRTGSIGLALTCGILSSASAVFGPSLGWWIRGGYRSEYGTYTALARGLSVGLTWVGVLTYAGGVLRDVLSGSSSEAEEKAEEDVLTGTVLTWTGVGMTSAFILADLVVQWISPTIDYEYAAPLSATLVPASFGNGGKGLLLMVEF